MALELYFVLSPTAQSVPANGKVTQLVLGVSASSTGIVKLNGQAIPGLNITAGPSNDLSLVIPVNVPVKKDDQISVSTGVSGFFTFLPA